MTTSRILLILLVLVGVQTAIAQPWQMDNSVFNPSGIPSFTFSQPRFADLDGDGDFDFLLGSTNYTPLYVENIGNPSTPTFVVGADITGSVSSLNAEMGVCADIDADGDLDLITGGYTGLHLFLNTGSVTAPQFTLTEGYFANLGVGSNPVPDLADVDGDNDLDLVVGLSEDGGVRLYLNTGTPLSGQFSQASMQVIGDVGLYAYPVFCDLDADGDQDILVGRDAHGFIYYQNGGSATAGDWQTNSALFAGLGMEDYWNSPDLVDLNNDDLYDLVFGTASGPLQYYVNTGTAQNPVWQQNTALFGGVLDVGGASSPAFYDFDNDGDLDLICGSQMGNIKYFENTGNQYAPAWEEDSAYFASIDHSIYAAVAIGDVNADNLPDAIIGDLSGNLYFHRNTGMGFVQQAGVLPAVTFGGWSVPRLVDMDGDGDLDLAVGNEAGNLRYFQNQGTAATPSWVEISGYFSNIDVGSDCSPSFGDVNGDGDLDLVAGNLFGEIRCYLRQGLSWQPNTTLFSGISTDQNAAPALVDLDHDGDLDLVVGDYDGTFSYHRNLMYSGAVLNPPLNLSEEISDGVMLTWYAPSAGSTSPFEHYNVYLDGVLATTTQQTQWHFSDLIDGTTYLASVTASYVAGESTGVSTGWTMPVHHPPLQPTYHLQPEQIDIAWLAPLPGFYALSLYRVYVNNALSEETAGTTYTIQNPQPGFTYQIAITAVYTDLVESAAALLEITFVAVDDVLEPVWNLSNHPNPFRPFTTISYELRAPSRVQLFLFDLRGRLIRTLVDAELGKGNHSAIWNGCDDRGKRVASGIYLYRLSTPGKTQQGKMILVK